MDTLDLAHEPATWGRSRFGGGYTDRRDEATCRRNLITYEEVYFRAAAELEAMKLDESAGNVPVGDVVGVMDRVSQAGRLVQWTKQRLLAIEYQREEAERRAANAARAAELRHELGLPEPARELSIEERREADVRAEQARVSAEQSAHPPVDPYSAEGKAQELKRLNESDPAWRAKHGLPPIMDAITAMRNSDR